MPNQEPANELRVLCPYCSEAFTAKMEEALSYSQGCDTCDHGSRLYGNIDVFCTNCEKLVYRKSY